jgi:uncharacterized protein (DUF4415 family)
MKGNVTVKKTLDLGKPAELIASQKLRLEALAAMPDEEIDYTDAPVLPEADWVRAAIGLPGTKQQITLRLDADVLAFFKNTGRRYQSRINAVLRSYVEAQKVQAK